MITVSGRHRSIPSSREATIGMFLGIPSSKGPASAPAVARPRAHPREGNEALRKGDLAFALKAYGAAIDEDPENAFAWNNKALVLEGLGRPQEALRCHNRALKLRPDYAEGWVNKAGTLLHTGKI